MTHDRPIDNEPHPHPPGKPLPPPSKDDEKDDDE